MPKTLKYKENEQIIEKKAEKISTKKETDGRERKLILEKFFFALNLLQVIF